ncbi:SCP2 sterol-binding domain-containing protein [Rhodobacteraceae bacterium NNCM2]|nr:SCP2 sterol-binding domain-containing protein [Coraliihabitans acroporae]
MSDILQKAMAALTAKVEESGFDGSVKFNIEDEGIIRIEDGAVTDQDGDSDVTISASADVLQDLFQGDLSPTAAFMTGKIKIDGDMGVAMKMSSLLG